MKKSTFLQILVTCLILLLVVTVQFVRGQNGVGIDVPNPLEMLDVNGAIKVGADFNNSNAAPQGGAGTIRWNGTNFEGWDGTQWIQFGSSGSSNLLQDTDTDTKVQVEESADEDIIRFDLAGTERFIMNGGRLEVVNSGRNTLIGDDAGLNMTANNVNTFIGFEAGKSATSTSTSVAIGGYAMNSLTGSGANVAIGNSALGNKTSGQDNLALGYQTGLNNLSGSTNTFVGSRSGLNATGSGNVFLGYRVGESETGNNKLYIDNSNTTTPLIYGDFSTNDVGIYGSLGIGTASPNQRLQVSDGGVNSSIGIGPSAVGPKLIYKAFQGGTKDLHFIFEDQTGTQTEVMTLRGNQNTGRLGLGTTTPQEELHVEGSIRMVDGNQQAGYVPISDANGTMVWTDPTGISGSVNEIVDADNDTKVQVEESADEDLIRFDIGGTEYFRMEAGRVAVSNTGESVSIGSNAGLNDDFSNNRNVAIGASAGRLTTTGENNVAVGRDALRSNTTGSLNVALGNYALRSNTTANTNVALGHYAMYATTTGESNVAIGSAPLRFNQTGGWNYAIGNDALYNNVSGSYNVAIGRYSGRATLGSGNVFLGDRSGQYEVGSNRLYIENSNSTTPLIYGEFDNDVVGINGNLGVGTQTPASALHVIPDNAAGPTATFETAGNQYPGAAVRVLPSTHATSERASVQLDDWHILQDRTGTGIKDFAIWQQSTASQRFNIDVNGNVGIGDETPDVKLDVHGNIQMVDGNQQVGYIPVSDANGTMTWTDPTTIATASVDEIVDADNDTKIQVEESADEDFIRFDTQGTERMMIRGDGRVAINNSNPRWPLTMGYGTNVFSSTDVIDPDNYAFALTRESGNNDEGIGMGFGSSSSGLHSGAGIVFKKTGNNSLGDLMLTVKSDGTSFGPHFPALTIKSLSGNVGIGTTTPSSKLDINGAINASGGGTFGNNIVVDGNIYFENTNGTGTNNPEFRLDGYQDKLYIIAESGSSGPASGTEVRFRTAASNSTAVDRVMISSQGNLGIGTTTPSSALHVVPTSANGPTVTIETGSNQYPSSLVINPSTHATSERATVRIDDWGILQDRTGTGVKDFAIYQNSTASQRFNIDVNGNVGIGDETPDVKLDVHGNIQMVDGNQAAGFIPVSDANGTMTWTNPTTIVTASVDEIVDADNDTKIQVEESADEDIIRFDMAGTQHFMMQSGRLVQTNSNNSQAFGANTLLNSTGSVNTAIGDRTLEDNTSGNDNIGMGFLALSSNTTGSNNVSIGTYSFDQLTTTNNNTALGKNAGYAYSGGGNTTLIGMDAGTQATGSNNTFLGHSAGSSSSGSDNVFLGRNAGSNVAASNRLYIDNSTTSAPLIYGEFDNDVVGINGNLGVGTIAPQQKLQVEVSQASGLSLPVLVRNSGATNSVGAGSGIGFVNHNAGTSAKAAIYNERVSNFGLGKMHFMMSNTADNTEVNLSTDARMTILSDGKVGIGEVSPQEELHVSGSIRMVDGNQQAGYIPVSDANGTMVWTAPSSLSGINVLSDADADTKIQVEESADEDLIRFDAGGVEAMVIDNSRHVGIGGVSSGEPLHLRNSGGIQLTNSEISNTTDASGVLFFDENYYNTGEAGDGHFNGNGGGLAIKNQDGWGALVSTSNMQWLDMDLNSLHVGGTSDPGNNNLVVDGNVGIGTTTTSATLDVVGDFQLVDGTQGNNKVLQSDANGNAAWGLQMYQSMGNNGYQVIGNMVIAWGRVSSNTDGNQLVSYPGGWPAMSAVYHIDAQVITVDDSSGRVAAYNTTSFTYNRDDNVSGTTESLQFMVIGRL